MAIEKSIGLAEAKNKLSALTSEANNTGMPFVIFKNDVPWVEVRPLAVRAARRSKGITITPLRHEVQVPDIDELFEGYSGDYRPQEDEFVSAAGNEVI